MGKFSNSQEDLIYKSILREGQEEVPPHIWDNISRNLDAEMPLKAAPSYKSPIWKRIAFSGAAAAAIAVSLLIWQSAPVITTSRQPITADSDARPYNTETCPEIQILSDTESSENNCFRTKKSVGGKFIAANTVTPTPERVRTQHSSENTAAIQENEIIQDNTGIRHQANQENTSKPTIEKEEQPMETELLPEEAADVGIRTDGRAPKEKFSLTLSGNTGGNLGNRSRFSPFRSPAANKPLKTGIIDNSAQESQFGLPITFGIGVKFNLAKRWAISTGINYTMLTRKFSGSFSDATQGIITPSDIRNTQHYIGIPIYVYYSIISSNKVDFYTYVGGSVERNVGNRYRISALDNLLYKEPVKGVQFSTGLGIGVEFLLSRHIGIYIDPSLRYYFNNSQPLSSRTVQPFSMNVELGIRARF